MFNFIYINRNGYLNGERLHRRYSTGCRKIFIGKEYVVKYEINDDSHSQCKAEWDLWKKLLVKERKYFIPTLYYFHSKKYDYTVQPYYNLKSQTEFLLSQHSIYDTKLKKICKKYGIDDLEGRLNDNWYIYNGEPIINDYGV